MRYALITGGVGFIASFLSRQLINGGHVDRIVAIDHYGRYVDSTRPNFIDFSFNFCNKLFDYFKIYVRFK